MSVRLLGVFALVLSSLLLGCGESESLPTVPVTGTITLDGKPVEGAAVTFVPKANDGRAASGTSDASGKYVLKTYLSPTSSPEGALPGDYFVTVTKLESPATAMTPEEMAKKMSGGGKMEGPKNALPQRYATAMTSGLTATVQGSGTNDFPFPLENK